METIADYQINNKRKMGHWGALIEEWILSIERFSRITDGDVPYWHNEYANVGVLAGAAWRCGRIALQEFQHEKVDNSLPKPKRNTKNGRCDLWICDENSKNEVIEAKFKGINMCSAKYIDISEALLTKAENDAFATKQTREDNAKAVALCFLLSYAHKNKCCGDSSIDKIIKDTILNIRKSINTDLAAWCFPKKQRNQIGGYDNKYIFPGVIMLAKTV